MGPTPAKVGRIRLEWCYLFRYTASPDPWSNVAKSGIRSHAIGSGIRCLDYKNVATVNNPLVYWPGLTGGATDPGSVHIGGKPRQWRCADHYLLDLMLIISPKILEEGTLDPANN